MTVELRLTAHEISLILEEWGRHKGYNVEGVDLFHMDGEEVCEAVMTVTIDEYSLLLSDDVIEAPELAIYRCPSDRGHVTGVGPQFGPQNYRVEYSLQDEGPKAYDEEFNTEEEALLFIEEEEKKNPLKGTMMYHLVDPTGHVRHIRV